MTMVSASFVHGQNVLPNGDFSLPLELSGWTAEGTGWIAFTNYQDADNMPPSGYMGLTYQPPTDTPEQAVSTCFAVTGGSSYEFGGKYLPTNTFGIISTAELACKSFNDANCTVGATDLGLANEDDTTHVNANPNFTSLVPVNGTLNSAARSAQCKVSTIMNDGGGFPDMTPSAGVGVDDLFFNLGSTGAPGLITLGGYLSGSWYDPTQSGQGFELEFTAQANNLIATWFTYSPDNSGTTRWVYGQGIYNPAQGSVTVPAVLTSGAAFPPNFVGADVKKTPWGTLTFTFTDCNHATMTWSSTLPGYGSGTQQLQRLTSIAGLSCPQ